jgi:hypothetical protein
VWRHRQAGTTDTQGRDKGVAGGGAGEPRNIPESRGLPWSSPRVLLSGSAPHPKRQSRRERGPRRAVTVIKSTWGQQDFPDGAGEGERERERLRREPHTMAASIRASAASHSQQGHRAPGGWGQHRDGQRSLQTRFHPGPSLSTWGRAEGQLESQPQHPPAEGAGAPPCPINSQPSDP